MKIKKMYAQAYKAFILEKHKPAKDIGCMYSPEVNGIGCAIGVSLSAQSGEYLDQIALNISNLYYDHGETDAVVYAIFHKTFADNPEYTVDIILDKLMTLQGWHDHMYADLEFEEAVIAFDKACFEVGYNPQEIKDLAKSLTEYEHIL